ncbi:MAG: fructose-bisphosphate aldolase [Acidobacteriota bacterium]|nr:fructose-bisphosphate aldolase [Blastocatellia bacterium]MDW8240566.1 fructose-bisphosphate aldolase [Acidobacteriota bacterium]
MSKTPVFTNRRMYRLFGEDGRSLVVAMDHGGGLNVYPSLSDPGQVIAAVVAGGADAVLTTPGILKHFYHQLKSVGVILRVDGGSSELEGSSGDYRLLYSVEDALRLGADAVACMGFPGSPLEAQTLGNIATLAAQCQRWGMPLMPEMIPGGFTNWSLRTVEATRLAVRIGIELGADFIKTEFVGSVDEFRSVVAHSYRPVLVLGGSRKDDDRALLSMVKQAMDAGASGVVIGRNVWGHPRPQAMVTALHRIIHGQASVQQALEVLESNR